MCLAIIAFDKKAFCTIFTRRAVIFAPFLCASAYHLPSTPKEATMMMDVIYVVVLLGFFALSATLVYGCERLLRRRS
jgi:hypothetical protein